MNNFEYTSNLDKILSIFEQTAVERIEEASRHVQRAIKKKLQGTRHGRIYYKKGKSIEQLENTRIKKKYWNTYRNTLRRYKKSKAGKISFDASVGRNKAEKSAVKAMVRYVNRGGQKLSAAQLGKRRYRASAPGEAPADTRKLLQKRIKYQMFKNGADVHGKIGFAADWEVAKYLEFGSPGMAKRPFVRVTFEQERNKIKQILGRRWIN